MKNFIKSVIVLIIISVVLVGCGTNNKVYDSVNVEKSVIKTVGEKNIVRCYFTPWISDFVDRKPQELAESSPWLYYYYKEKDGTYNRVSYTYEGTECTIEKPIYSETYDYSLNPERLFEASDKVKNPQNIEQTYCFHIFLDSYDTLIYYVTDQGDYVYWHAEDFDYLIPQGVFYEAANAYKLKKEEVGTIYGGHLAIEEAYDLTEYSITVE